MKDPEFLGLAFLFHETQERLSKEALTLALKKTQIFSAVCRLEFEHNIPNNCHISYIISMIYWEVWVCVSESISRYCFYQIKNN